MEIVHLLGLTLLLGAILVMSLRLLGLSMTDRPLSLVTADFGNWMLAGIITMLVSGGIKFITQPMKLYYSDPYWLKMYFLGIALVFHFTVFRKVTHTDKAHPLMRGLTGVLALILWFGVGIFGRAIGFF